METLYHIRRRLSDRIHYLPIVLLIFWTVFPLVWAFSASFKTYNEVYKTPASLIPESFSFHNYIRVFESTGFYSYLLNSITISVISTAICLFVSVLAAYGFSRFTFKFSNVLLIIILIPRIIPRASLIIPLFRMISAFGLLDTYAALIITYTATSIPLATWVLTGFFKSIPMAIEEAASIDGANQWQRIWHVMVPVSLPAFITVSVFSLREAWNEFPFVLSFTQSSKMRTLPYQLFLLRDSLGVEDWPLVLAFTLITILPILILYLVFQRKVVDGIVSGAVK